MEDRIVKEYQRRIAADPLDTEAAQALLSLAIRVNPENRLKFISKLRKECSEKNYTDILDVMLNEMIDDMEFGY